MKKIIIVTIFSLAMCSFTFAQSPLPELDKVKQIKRLKSTRDDVLEILKNDIFPSSDASDHYERFYTEDAIFSVFYSSGKCSEENEDWNIPEWKVTDNKNFS